MTAQNNPLVDSGKPLFFRVDPGADVGLSAPAPRLAESTRVCVRSLGGMQKEALVVSSAAGVTWRLASDEGAYLAGLDAAPCPLSFLTTGMIASYMTEIRALAGQRQIPLAAIRLVQDNYYTMAGSALKGTMTGGARDVHLAAQIDSPAPHDALRQLVLDAVIASPLNGLLRARLRSRFALWHNGRPIEPGRAGRISDATPMEPACRFDAAAPAAGDWTPLIRRGGPTPRATHTVTLANDSLAAEQNRLLHVRGICTLREDGVKEVEQQLFNPHGSIFRFLSDEAPAAGGRGIAPDAASYVSAGIGFCFMTQFGRYAKIVRRPLQDYRIVQDAHFSRGGASGGTGTAGRAEPVDTHVYLESAEDDEFARDALDMAEQTCFLHALLRSELRTRVALLPFGEAAPTPRAPPDWVVETGGRLQ